MGEITEACFALPSGRRFCVPGSTVQWGAESLAMIDLCENRSWDATRVSETEDHGLWQVNVIYAARLQRMGYAWEQVTDPAVNGMLALSIWSDGQHWGPWSCRGFAEGAVIAHSGEW